MLRARRVVSKFLCADLNPPLGEPGGPCQVVQRIHDTVPPRLQDRLIHDLETGHESNMVDMSKVYPTDMESGAGFVKQLAISAHAQFRMDLRSITVDDLKAFFKEFTQDLENLKSKDSNRFNQITMDMMYGNEISYRAKRLGLFVAWKMAGSVAKIITTYWPNHSTPKMPAGGCD